MEVRRNLANGPLVLSVNGKEKYVHSDVSATSAFALASQYHTDRSAQRLFAGSNIRGWTISVSETPLSSLWVASDLTGTHFRFAYCSAPQSTGFTQRRLASISISQVPTRACSSQDRFETCVQITAKVLEIVGDKQAGFRCKS